MTKEHQIEEQLIEQLVGLKYIHRPDIIDRRTLEQNFKAKFEALNRVRLSDSEFLRLREEIIEPDVFSTSKKLRERQYFLREDGIPFLGKATKRSAKNFSLQLKCRKLFPPLY